MKVDHAATYYRSADGNPSAETEWASDRTELIRSVVTAKRPRLTETILRQGCEDIPATADASAPNLRMKTAQQEIRVIEFPQFQPLEGRGASMAAMQEWEGVITAVEDGTVYADLIDITAGHQHVDEAAELPLEEFDPDDREQLRRGTVFRWAIGYLKVDGTRFGTSVLRLRHSAPLRGNSMAVKPLAFEHD